MSSACFRLSCAHEVRELAVRVTIQDNFLFRKVMRVERPCRSLLERLLCITISKIVLPQIGKTLDTGFKARSVRLEWRHTSCAGRGLVRLGKLTECASVREEEHAGT